MSDKYRYYKDKIEIMNCIALHDFGVEGIKWKEWYYWCEELFQKRMGVEPVWGIAQGIKKENYGDGRKYITHKGVRRKLEKFNFEKLAACSINCMRAKSKKEADSQDYFAYSTLRLNTDWLDCSLLRKEGSWSVLCLDDAFLPFDRNTYIEFMLKLQEFSGAKYGYFYRLALKYMPDGYAYGSMEKSYFGEPDDPIEYARVKNWDNHISPYSGDYETGDFRQVFQYNLLSRENLEREVRPGVSFESWIKEDGRHGILHDHGSGVFIWEVEVERIEELNHLLEPSGLLIALTKAKRRS